MPQPVPLQTYVEAISLGTGGGGGGGGGGSGMQMQSSVTPTGVRPGTVFSVPQLGSVDPDAILLTMNGLTFTQVVTPAAEDEFSLLGTTVTTFISVQSTDKLIAWLWYSSVGTMNSNVTPTGPLPGTDFVVPTLGGVGPTAIIAVLNGLVLNQVSSPAANDEFSLSGVTLTTFITVTSTDKFKVFLWY